jgi:hypothetical protein
MRRSVRGVGVCFLLAAVWVPSILADPEASVEASERQLLPDSGSIAGNIHTTGGFNGLVMIMAERLSDRGFETGQDYLVATTGFWNASGQLRAMRLSLLGPPTPYSFGGRNFFRIDAIRRIGHIEVHEAWVATIHKGHALVWNIGADDKGAFDSICETLESLEFRDAAWAGRRKTD